MSVRYVANVGVLRKIARSDEIAGVMLRCAQNGASAARSLTGEKFNAKVYKRGAFRSRGVIFPDSIAIRTQQKVRALKAARPRM